MQGLLPGRKELDILEKLKEGQGGRAYGHSKGRLSLGRLQETTGDSSWTQPVSPEKAIPFGLYEVLDTLVTKCLQGTKSTLIQALIQDMSKEAAGNPFPQEPSFARSAEPKVCWG